MKLSEFLESEIKLLDDLIKINSEGKLISDEYYKGKVSALTHLRNHFMNILELYQRINK